MSRPDLREAVERLAHRWGAHPIAAELRATLAKHPAENEEREALADLLESLAGRDLGWAADTVLTSGWLRGHDAAVIAKAKESA